MTTQKQQRSQEEATGSREHFPISGPGLGPQVYVYRRVEMPRLDTTGSNMADRQVDDRVPESSNNTGNVNNVSFTLSTPTSPTTYRRPRTAMSRRDSQTEGPDERSPLLQASRSRIRIQSIQDSFRVPDLSRNHSYSGRCATCPYGSSSFARVRKDRN